MRTEAPRPIPTEGERAAAWADLLSRSRRGPPRSPEQAALWRAALAEALGLTCAALGSQVRRGRPTVLIIRRPRGRQRGG